MLLGSRAILLHQIKVCLARLCELISTAQVVNPPRNDLSLRKVFNDEYERCIVIPSLPL